MEIHGLQLEKGGKQYMTTKPQQTNCKENNHEAKSLNWSYSKTSD